MSVIFNQTNIAAGSAFSSGGGAASSNFPTGINTPSIINISTINGTAYPPAGSGSNFTNGIAIGESNLIIQQGTIPYNYGPPVGYISDSDGSNVGWLADPIWSGGNSMSYIRMTSTVIDAVASDGTTEKRFLTVDPGQIAGEDAAFALTNISTINGSVPTFGAAGPKILYGIVSFATNGQTVTFPTPFATNPAVFLQPTGNAAGVNGFFQVNNGTTYTTSFQIFYSGALVYGPIEVNWMAIGT